MKFFDVIRYDSSESRNVFAWRTPNKHIRYGATLQVSPGQTAILFMNGRLVESYGSGKHRIDGNSSQILTPIKKMFTGGINPDSTELWFINTFEIPPISWGTPERSQVRIYTKEGRSFTAYIGSHGNFKVKIKDNEKFINHFMVGAPEDTITFEYIQHIFLREFLHKITDILSVVYSNGKIAFDQISTQKSIISKQVLAEIKDGFDMYGIDLVDFRIEKISLDDKTNKFLRKIELERELSYEEGMKEYETSNNRIRAEKNYSDSRRYSQENEGYSYQQKRGFDVLEKMVENEGNSNDLFHAGLGLSTGIGIGKEINKNISNIFDKNREDIDTDSDDFKYCYKCGKKTHKESIFCSNCGQKLKEL